MFEAMDCLMMPLSPFELKSLPLKVWRLSWRLSKYNMLSTACEIAVTDDNVLCLVRVM